ncbi:MAG: hypothetical protein U0X76_00475 [Bacteroidia bacterium]
MKAIWADNTPFFQVYDHCGSDTNFRCCLHDTRRWNCDIRLRISVEEMQKVMDGDSLQSLNIMRIVQTLASLGTFVLPPFFLAYTFGGNPKAYLGLDKTPKNY